MGTLKDAVIFDLDGTLADITHRLHFVRGQKRKDWGSFFRAIPQDTLRQDVYDLYNMYVQDYTILLVSGRPETYRTITWDWLTLHNISHPLYMREKGDFRPDTIVKAEIYDQLIAPYYRIHIVVDDRPSVLRMWKEKGLSVIDVGKGEEF